MRALPHLPTLAALVTLSACTMGDQLVDRGAAFDTSRPEVDRFARGSSFPNEGLGGVALDDVVPGMWVSMGDVVCAIDGSDGSIGLDVFPDEDDDTQEVTMVDADQDGFLVVDGRFAREMGRSGVFGHRVLPEGELVAGERLEGGGMALVIDTGTGCALQLDRTVVALSASPCLAHTDIDERGSSLVVTTADGVMVVDGVDVDAVSTADQASVDPVTGGLWMGSTGGTSLVGDFPKRAFTVDLGAPLVDFEARGGVVVALTETPELVRLDAATGGILDREPFVGNLDVDRLMLGSNARSVVLESPTKFSFYRVRTDAQVGR